LHPVAPYITSYFGGDFRAYDLELLMEILDISLESVDFESMLRRRNDRKPKRPLKLFT
jgi:hypothetical protein